MDMKTTFLDGDQAIYVQQLMRFVAKGIENKVLRYNIIRLYGVPTQNQLTIRGVAHLSYEFGGLHQSFECGILNKTKISISKLVLCMLV